MKIAPAVWYSHYSRGDFPLPSAADQQDKNAPPAPLGGDLPLPLYAQEHEGNNDYGNAQANDLQGRVSVYTHCGATRPDC